MFRKGGGGSFACAEISRGRFAFLFFRIGIRDIGREEGGTYLLASTTAASYLHVMCALYDSDIASYRRIYVSSRGYGAWK